MMPPVQSEQGAFFVVSNSFLLCNRCKRMFSDNLSCTLIVYGVAVVIPLGEITAHIHQLQALFPGFYTLSYNLHIQLPGYGRNALHQDC